MTDNHEPARDFDFLMGGWIVHHRRLRRRLVNDVQWDEFTGTMDARPILAGNGNFDENVIRLPGGVYQACTLRLYSPATNRWSIHWIDGRDPKLDPPMTGGFENGVGIFLGEDRHEGRPVKVRFIWSRTDSATPRWEQAFSADDGLNWETNWTMDFERREGAQP